MESWEGLEGLMPQEKKERGPLSSAGQFQYRRTDPTQNPQGMSWTLPQLRLKSTCAPSRTRRLGTGQTPLPPQQVLQAAAFYFILFYLLFLGLGVTPGDAQGLLLARCLKIAPSRLKGGGKPYGMPHGIRTAVLPHARRTPRLRAISPAPALRPRAL